MKTSSGCKTLATLVGRNDYRKRGNNFAALRRELSRDQISVRASVCARVEPLAYACMNGEAGCRGRELGRWNNLWSSPSFPRKEKMHTKTNYYNNNNNKLL